MTPQKQWRGMLAAEIIDELYARIEALEAQSVEAKRKAERAASDAYARSLSGGGGR